MNPKFNFPTERVPLPSQGKLYPSDHPLAEGFVEMKLMTAKEEDILSNQNYIRQGIVIDKLLQSMIVTKFDYNDLLVIDKDAIMIAARILGYGKDYEFQLDGETHTVDLSSLPDKPIEITSSVNEFAYTFPKSGVSITYKFLTHGDEKAIEKEIEGLKKIDKNGNYSVSTRMKFLITSVGGDRLPETIRHFVDNYLLAQDLRSFRKHLKETTPGVDMSYTYTNSFGEEEVTDIPLGLNFFWPGN